MIITLDIIMVLIDKTFKLYLSNKFFTQTWKLKICWFWLFIIFFQLFLEHISLDVFAPLIIKWCHKLKKIDFIVDLLLLGSYTRLSCTLWLSACSVRNMNTAKSLKKSRKKFASWRKRSSPLGSDSCLGYTSILIHLL